MSIPAAGVEMPGINRRTFVASARIVAPALFALAVHALLFTAAAYALQQVAEGSNPFAGQRLYIDPNSVARRQAETWRRSRPQDAALIARISEQPVAKWIGSWVTNVQREINQAVKTITGAGALPVFVAYNIPHRDYGSYSAGGAASASVYRRWIQDFAKGLGGKRAVVILESDALAGMDCLNATARQERVTLIREAVDTLKGCRRGKGQSAESENGPSVNLAPR